VHRGAFVEEQDLEHAAPPHLVLYNESKNLPNTTSLTFIYLNEFYLFEKALICGTLHSLE